MELIITIIGLLLILAGIGGCILPIIPGPPIAFIGMLVFHFAGESFHFSTSVLVIYGILAVAITALDFVIPAWGTKKFGGTKWGSRGSTIGLLLIVVIFPILGFVIPFVGPLMGVIVGPFLGAYIGERIGGMSSDGALKAGFGSFIGFLAGTFIKLVYCFVVLCLAVIKYDFLPI